MCRKQRNDNAHGNKHPNSQIALKEQHKAYNGNRHNADFKVLCDVGHTKRAEKGGHNLPESGRKHGVGSRYAR